MAITITAQKINDTDAVRAAAEKLRTAMISGEKSALESLILPELTYGHSGGHIDDAREFVEKLVTKKSDFLTIDITNQTVQIVGNTAIVRHHFTQRPPTQEKLPVMLLWIFYWFGLK